MSSGIESYNMRMCLVYARSGTSYSMYTFMSRWLPKTLCHNVCGISSEPVTAVAVLTLCASSNLASPLNLLAAMAKN